MNEYYDELKDISYRAQASSDTTSLIVAATTRVLMGVIQSPIDIQYAFSEYLEGYARSALIELQMRQIGRFRDD